MFPPDDNDSSLPKGRVTTEWEGSLADLYPRLDNEEICYEATNMLPRTCTCGAAITYGKDCPLEFHSIDVCDLHVKPKKIED